MAQEHLGFEAGVERRRAPRRVISHVALSWGFGLFEGACASLMWLVPAFVYHFFVAQVPLSRLPVDLYGAYAVLVGVVYGTFSATAATRVLEGRAEDQHAIFADSAIGWTGAFGVALLVAFLSGSANGLSRVSLSSAYLIGVPVLLTVRGIAHLAVGTRIRAGRLQYRKFGVVGARGDIAKFLVNGALWRSGYQLVGTLGLDAGHAASEADHDGAIIEAGHRWVANGAGYIVLVGDLGDIGRLERVSQELKRFSVNVACAPATDNTSFKFVDIVPLGVNNAVRFLCKPMGDGAVLTKRAFDLTGAVLGLLLLAPLLVIVAVLIRLDSPGPVFYRQERRGFNGEDFFIWKFRSMRVTESGRHMVQARRGDARITRIGRFIRAASIDELPQLLNVLKGDMSLVGPRPHALVHDDALGEQLASYAHRQRIKPGITGWAQVNGYRGQTSTFAQIEGRTLYDLYYIDNWSIFFDCWIIFMTVVSSKARLNAV